MPLPLLSTDFWQEPITPASGKSLPNSANKTFCPLLKVVIVRLVLEAMMFQRHNHYLEIHTK